MRGSSCAFAHSEEELRNRPILNKTSLCKLKLAGAECLDPECRFAHSAHELQSTNSFFKTKMCRHFLSAAGCKLGDNCRHAHAVEELQKMPDLPPEAFNFKP